MNVEEKNSMAVIIWHFYVYNKMSRAIPLDAMFNKCSIMMEYTMNSVSETHFGLHQCSKCDFAIFVCQMLNILRFAEEEKKPI